MRTDITISVPDIEWSGVPQYVMKRMGESAVEAHNNRLRNLSLTADGEAIDRNDPSWEEAKRTGTTEQMAIDSKPLIYTGATTLAQNWTVETKGDTIHCELNPGFSEHVREALDRAEGRNWEYAYGAGEQELAAVMKTLDYWVRTGEILTFSMRKPRKR